jgi:hypothetical protein
MLSPMIKQIDSSFENCSLNLKPSAEKKSRDAATFETGMLINIEEIMFR